MKVKSESEVGQWCPTLSDPMDCSPPGSSVHGFFRQEYWSGVSLPSPHLTSLQISISLFLTYNALVVLFDLWAQHFGVTIMVFFFKISFFLMWTIFKIFIDFFFTILLLFLCFSFLAVRHVRCYLPYQGSNLHPLPLKGKSWPLDCQGSPCNSFLKYFYSWQLTEYLAHKRHLINTVDLFLFFRAGGFICANWRITQVKVKGAYKLFCKKKKSV